MSEARDLIDAALSGEHPHSVVETVVDEDWNIIQRRRPGIVNYRRSRIAQRAFRKHRFTYQRAAAQWQRSGRAKLFYRKLARYNTTRQHDPAQGLSPWLITAKKSFGFGDSAPPPVSLTEFFTLVMEEFAESSSPLEELSSIAGHILDELAVCEEFLNESAVLLNYYMNWCTEILEALSGQTS